MAIRTTNGTTSPMILAGAVLQNGVYANSPYLPSYYNAGYASANIVSHKTVSITYINQVVGLVPVFPCDDPECRNGRYGSNDTEFMLPVFAESTNIGNGNYKNDFNTFLFDIPSNSALTGSSFFLDKKIGDDWSELVELDDNKYGVYYPIGKLCDKNYFTGYNIYWQAVLRFQGEGVYRFRVGLSTGAFVESTNHFKIIGLKPSASVQLSSVGYGLICPTFFINDALSYDDNMINMVAFINTYQSTVNPEPLFEAVWNSGTSQIDLFGLLAQNCVCSALVTNVTYSNYALVFSGGVDTYEELVCFASPPFCLKTWDCWAVDQTTRFDATYSGGVIGNVAKAYPGTTWSFCCSGRPVVYPEQKSLFTLQFWEQGIIYESTTFTFTPDLGYDLVTPVTFTPGTTATQCATQLALAINTYQATLTPPQFSAVVSASSPRRVDITHLFGQNIGILISFTDKNPVPFGNTIQLTLNSLVTWLANTGTPPNISQNVQGSFTGGSVVGASVNAKSTITWKDSIRVGGQFGYENTEFERKSIKYQTGVVNKVRDELILTHTWKSSSLPFWFHERFKAYGLMADDLLVSDYNMNNSDYNIKLYSVQGDSSYSPEYKGFPRETQVKCDFKPRTQNLKRTRCC